MSSYSRIGLSRHVFFLLPYKHACHVSMNHVPRFRGNQHTCICTCMPYIYSAGSMQVYEFTCVSRMNLLASTVHLCVHCAIPVVHAALRNDVHFFMRTCTCFIPNIHVSTHTYTRLLRGHTFYSSCCRSIYFRRKKNKLAKQLRYHAYSRCACPACA
jgi:hypothetical protein